MPSCIHSTFARIAAASRASSGIRSDEAARIASSAGTTFVMDHCMKIEHARIMGGLNWAGVNTGMISARRHV